jgi:hypothetical protein
MTTASVNAGPRGRAVSNTGLKQPVKLNTAWSGWSTRLAWSLAVPTTPPVATRFASCPEEKYPVWAWASRQASMMSAMTAANLTAWPWWSVVRSKY